jgi:hypothetical protein
MLLDRPSRDRYAELLEQFADGQLTNDEYEDAACPLLASRDPALGELWWAMWHAYDDLHEHRLTGKHELTRDGRAAVSRMVLFLQSDLPYEWAVPGGRIGGAVDLLTLGFLGRTYRRWRAARYGGDEGVWPFFRAGDLARAAGRGAGHVGLHD